MDDESFDRWDEAVRVFVDVRNASGSQIKAIKEVRERFGLDLVMAKEVAARAQGFRDLDAAQAELIDGLRAILDDEDDTA